MGMTDRLVFNVRDGTMKARYIIPIISFGLLLQGCGGPAKQSEKSNKPHFLKNVDLDVYNKIKAIKNLGTHNDLIVSYLAEDLMSSVPAPVYEKAFNAVHLERINENNHLKSYVSSNSSKTTFVIEDFSQHTLKLQDSRRTLKKVNRKIQDYSSIANFFNSTSPIVNGLSDVISSYGTPYTKLAATGVNLAYKGVATAVDSMATQKSIELIGYVAREIVGKKERELVKGLDAKKIAIIDKKFKLQEAIREEIKCGNCSEAVKSEVTNLILKNLELIVKESIAKNIDLEKHLNTNEVRLQDTIKSIFDMQNRISELRDNLYETGKNILHTQKDFAAQVEKIQKRLSLLAAKDKLTEVEKVEFSKNTQFLDLILNKNVSASKVKLMLRQGDFGSMKEDGYKVKELAAHLNEKLRAYLGDYIYGARSVLEVSDKLGIQLPRDFKVALSEGIKAYDTANAFLKNIANQNYVGLAMNISNIFGGNGTVDVEQQRHAQIMGALSVMDKKLDALLYGQRKLLQGQEEIKAKLQVIIQNQKEHTEFLYKHISLVQDGINDLIEIEKNKMKNSQNSCLVLTEALKREQKRSDYKSTLRSISKLLKNSSFMREKFEACQQLSHYLRETIERGEIHNSFKFLHDRQSAEHSLFVKTYFHPMVNNVYKVLKESYARENVLPSISLLLNKDAESLYRHFQPELQAQTGRFIMDKLMGNFFDGQAASMSNYRAELTSRPLAVGYLLDVAKSSLKLHALWSLRDREIPFEFNSILKTPGAGDNSHGYFALKGLYLNLLAAKSQIAIMDGTAFIPALYEVLEDSFARNDELGVQEIIEIAQDIFKISPVAQKNFMIYYIVNKINQMHGDDTNTFLHGNLDLIYRSKLNSRLVEELTPYFYEGRNSSRLYCSNDLTVSHCFWEVQVRQAKLTFTLPSYAEIVSGKFISHPLANELDEVMKATLVQMSTYKEVATDDSSLKMAILMK